MSNVGSGATRNSLTHSQLVGKQKELELKRKELELEKREAVLTAEEKLLALSNLCSGVGIKSPQNERTAPLQLNTSFAQNVLNPQRSDIFINFNRYKYPVINTRLYSSDNS